MEGQAKTEAYHIRGLQILLLSALLVKTTSWLGNMERKLREGCCFQPDSILSDNGA